ncbi:MAG: acyl-CoA dehydrogenase family protein [Chloroflexota bacterium]
MVSFELTQDQLEWQKKTRAFVEKEVKPAGLRIDRNPDHKSRFDWDIIKKLAKEGIWALYIPKEYGGAGLDALTLAIIQEEIAAGDAGIAFTAALTWFSYIQFGGREEQKRKYIPPFCDRENPKLSAMGLTEPGSGSDPASISTTAKLEGDEYVINGTKCFFTNGGLADPYVIIATADRSKGARGISAFVVPADAKGLSIGKVEDKMGFRSSQTTELSLKDVRVPKEDLLGEEGRGLTIALASIDFARVLNAGVLGVGLARAAYETALGFARERVRFDKAGLEQQTISFALVDMATTIEAGRLLAWKCCSMMDSNVPYTTMGAMTKLFGSDLAVKVTTDAVQIVGLHSYSDQYPVEKYMRDAKLLQIYEGTNQVQRVIVARQLIAS